MLKKYSHLLISIIIIALSIFYAFKGVKMSELGDAFQSVRYVYIIPAVFFVVLTYLFRALRWHYIIGSIKEVRTLDLFPPLMIGFMANMMPARAGEFIRAYLLSRREKINFSTSFATVFIEKLFDLLFVLLLLVFVLVFLPDVFASGEAGAFQLVDKAKLFGKFSGLICLLIFIFSGLLQFRNDLAMKILGVFVGPLPSGWRDRIIRLVNSFTDGLEVIRDKRGFSATILLTILIWSSIILIHYPLYFAFDIAAELPAVSSLLILCLTIAIFISVAPTPGFIGSFHLAFIAVLHGIFGIQKATALSFSIVTWFISMGLAVTVGAIFAIKENVSFKEFLDSRDRTE